MGKTITWPKAVESIEAEGSKTYYVGDTLDVSDLKVVANLKDGSVVEIPSDRFNAIPKVFTTAGQAVTVLYRWGAQAFTCEATGITVNDLEITSVSINSDFSKKSYKVNEEFDPSGFSLFVKYNSGNFDIIADGITFSEPDMTSAGEKTITATYEGKEVTSSIEVEDIKAITLKIMANPDKLDYYWGESLDVTGLEVSARFDDGSLADVTNECTFAFNNGDTVTEATEKIVVNYEGISKDIPVNVIPDTITISGVSRTYKIGEIVRNISAVVDRTQEAVEYTINGESVTSYLVTSADLETGIIVEAVYYGATAVIEAGVVNEVDTSDFLTLNDAVAAIAPGGIVNVMEDSSITSTLALNKSMTIEGNYHAINTTGVTGSGVIIATAVTGEDVTIRNLTIERDSIANFTCGIDAQVGASELTLEGVELSNYRYPTRVRYGVSDLAFNITDSVISGGSAILLDGTANITVTDSNLTGNNTFTGDDEDFAVINCQRTKNSTISISGGTLTATRGDNCGSEALVEFRNLDDQHAGVGGNSVIIENCEITGGAVDPEKYEAFDYVNINQAAYTPIADNSVTIDDEPVTLTEINW